MTLHSSLAPLAAINREPDPNHARRVAREAFHRDGIVLINPSWLQGWGDRELLLALAAKVHGKRRTPT